MTMTATVMGQGQTAFPAQTEPVMASILIRKGPFEVEIEENFDSVREMMDEFENQIIICIPKEYPDRLYELADVEAELTRLRKMQKKLEEKRDELKSLCLNAELTENDRFALVLKKGTSQVVRTLALEQDHHDWFMAHAKVTLTDLKEFIPEDQIDEYVTKIETESWKFEDKVKKAETKARSDEWKAKNLKGKKAHV